MDKSYIVSFLNKRIGEMSYANTFTGRQAVIERYDAVIKLIKACGHDTRDFEQALHDADQALEKLDIVQDQTIDRFKANGICFVKDETPSEFS